MMEMREQIPGLQFVVMEMPILNDGSRYSAQAALALKEIEGEEAYVRFVDEMMRNAGPANVATVLKVLTKLGHDAEEIVKAIKDGKGADELNRARDLADALGVTGTPYFVGPGGIIRGVASKDRLQALTIADGSDS
ncbi:dsba oxidoreductase [Ruegeria sp. TrichCH4B]|nr:dsba oxidoreductase [Ruegeria sp. TrichCH4B]